MANGFFLGGLSGGITDAANSISNDMKLVSLLKYQQGQQQQNQQHNEYMQLRAQAVEHLGETISQIKTAHPELTDMQIASNPAVVAMKDQLAGFDQNLKLPNTADSIVAGFVARPSEALQKRAIAQAEGTYGKNMAETQELQARTGVLNQQSQNLKNATDTSASINAANPDLDTQGDRQATADAWLSGIKDPGMRDDIKGVYLGTTNPSTLPTRTYAGTNKSQKQLAIEGAERYGQLLGVPYDARNYSAGQSTLTQFTSGKKGDTVRSFNVLVDHLSTLQDAASALGNGDTRAFNSISQSIAQATGNPAPTNFDAVKNIVKDEINKAVLGGAGALGDRESINATIDKASSPQQLAGVIQNYQKLAGGQLGGLRKQYESGTGRKDFDSKFLNDRTKKLFNQGGSEGTPPPPPGFNVLGQ